MYYETTVFNFTEIQGNGTISDFFLTVRTKHPFYANAEMFYLNRKFNKKKDAAIR